MFILLILRPFCSLYFGPSCSTNFFPGLRVQCSVDNPQYCHVGQPLTLAGRSGNALLLINALTQYHSELGTQGLSLIAAMGKTPQTVVQGRYSPTILKRTLVFCCKICKFECNTTSDWLNRMV